MKVSHSKDLEEGAVRAKTESSMCENRLRISQ